MFFKNTTSGLVCEVGNGNHVEELDNANIDILVKSLLWTMYGGNMELKDFISKKLTIVLEDK